MGGNGPRRMETTMRAVVWLVAMSAGCSSSNPTEPSTAVELDEPGAAVDADEPAPQWESDDDGSCPDSWVLTYSLTGRVDITHTPLDLGNADATVGGLATDELVLRVSDDNGSPKAGRVVVTDFELTQDFEVAVNMFGEIAIVSDLLLFAEDECGVATGRLNGQTLSWDGCEFGPQHGSNEWGPDDGAYGPGCLNDYHVEGTIECIDESLLVSCSDGWLDEGENTFDYVYNQPMLNLVFDGPDLGGFTMYGDEYGAEVPTYSNNRTWLGLTGELKEMALEPTPECLCAG